MQDTSNVRARSIQIAFLAIMVGIWYGLSQTGSVSPLFLPPIDSVQRAFVRLVQTGQFWSAVRVTMVTIAQAWLIAVVLGITVAYLVTRSQHWTRVFEPVIAGTFAIPLTLLFPVFILFFGIGPSSKVAYAATYGFFPVALNTIAGLSSVDERYLRAAKSMGASSLDTFRHVLFPAAFPVILTGLRVSFFISFASVLGGETLSSAAGIGKNIALAAELMEPARLYAWIVFVICTTVTLNFVVTAVENRRRDY
jgi:ABC-type nitrate/sulfonate/bicarbonate transport system permease component